jgi:hypothetical protein
MPLVMVFDQIQYSYFYEEENYPPGRKVITL